MMFLICGGLLFGCSTQAQHNQTNVSSTETHTKKTVYTSFYPIYDLTKRIVGDKMNVKMIIDNNQEAHGFELTPQVMKDIQEADAVIYNGAGMEEFIDDLKASVKDKVTFVDLSEGLTLLTTGDGLTDIKKTVNPHTWLSVKNAMMMVETITEQMSRLDDNHKSYYETNLKQVKSELEALDKEFKTAIDNIKRSEKYFVVSHAAFNYLAFDYGLKQIAVTGISPEEEPTAQQLKIIADFVVANHISTIFFEGKATPKVAQTLADNTKAKTGSLYTMETLTQEEMAKGYIGLMKENLKALVASFNE